MSTSWEDKRFSTLLVYAFQYFLIAVELSISFTTSWLYLKEVVKNEHHLNMYYGLTHTATVLPSIMLVNVVAHYADKYRKIKLLMLTANSFTLLGCVIFLIPGSPLYILAGRFFIGFNLSIRPLMIGEMARSYSREELTSKIQIFRGIFVLGKAAGPLGVVLFLNTNFWIGSLHIRYANISSLITFILVFIIQLLLFFFGHDLSNEFDQKEKFLVSDNTKENNEIKSIDENTLTEKNPEREENCYVDTDDVATDTEVNKNKDMSSFQLLRKVLKEIDVIFLLISVFIEQGTAQMMVLLIPVVIIENLKYSRSTVNVVFAIQLISFSVIFIILYFSKLKQVTSALLGWFVGILFLCGVMIASRSFGYVLNVIILTISLTLVDIFDLNLKVFFSASLANLVQSKYQSFMESIRMEVHFFASIGGSLLTPVAAQHLTEVGSTLIVIVWAISMLTFINRQTFTHMKIKV